MTTSSGAAAGSQPAQLQAGTAIWAEAVQGLVAQAFGVEGSAEAAATVPLGVVAYQPQATTIEGSGGLNGIASSSLTATAVTVGDNSAVDHAIAQAVGVPATSGAVTAALDLSAGPTTIGSDAQASGSATLSGSAEATTVNGDATALASGAETTGIKLIGQSLNAGDVAAIKANAIVNLIAKATASEGDAYSSLADPGGSSGTFALTGSDTSQIVIGGAASLDAVARDNATAIATAVEGSTTATNPYAAEAIASRSYVQAVRMGDVGASSGLISTGEELQYKAEASSKQSATAQSSGTANPTGDGSRASTAASNFILGTSNSQIDIGDSSSSFLSSALLETSSKAVAVSGHAYSETAGSSFVAGGQSLDLTIGKNAENGLTFIGGADLSAIATSTQGWAHTLVDSGTVTGLNVPIAGMGSNIKVGGDASLISGIGNVSSTSKASTVGTQLASPSSTPQAQAQSSNTMNNYGIGNTDIDIGGDAKIYGAANTNLRSQAEIVSAGALGSNAASSEAGLDARGIEIKDPNVLIKIADMGQVSGVANSGLSSIASSVKSANANQDSTSAVAQVTQSGIGLGDKTSQVLIGNSGSVIGDSFVGGTATPYQGSKGSMIVESTSVEDSTRSYLQSPTGTEFSSQGIVGSYNSKFSEIHAGTKNGDIVGRSQFNAIIAAANTGDQTDTSIGSITQAGNTTNLIGGAGILRADLYAGNQGNNRISGSSGVNISLSSSSTHGNVTSNGNLGSGGILNKAPSDTSNVPNAKATIAGTMQALSQMSGSSLSQTVYGSAQSNLNSQSLGISAYDVTIPGAGNFEASGVSQIGSRSISVQGSV